MLRVPIRMFIFQTAFSFWVVCALLGLLPGCGSTPLAQQRVDTEAATVFVSADEAGEGEESPLAAEEGQLTVLITGANRGLGLEMAKQFSEDGYFVIGTARRPERATDLAALGARVEQLDVVDADSVAALAERLDGHRVDILINSAGYFGPVPLDEPQPTIDDLDPDDVLRCLEVNTVGPLRVTQALLENLRASETRKIINISTRQAILQGNISAGDAYGYRVSKTGLNMMTRVIAGDLADEGFIVVSLAPGWVKTDMGTHLAELTPQESIRDVKQVIESLTAEHNGGFWFHDGSARPW